MPEVPSFSSQRQVINAQRENIDTRRTQEATKDWVVMDSPLSMADPNKRLNSNLSFEGTFLAVIPPAENGEKSLQRYIETALEPKKGQALGVELGGPAHRLFKEFTPGFFKMTAGVVLTDSSAGTKIESGPNHSVLAGDVFGAEGYLAVKNWADGNKVDLIIERMIGGINSAPEDLGHQLKILNKWYELLSTNGLMFIQIPTNSILDEENRPIFERWYEMLKRDYSDVLDIDRLNWMMRIHKLEGAPEHLPRVPLGEL